MAMIIIDSQVHIWGPETPTKPYFTKTLPSLIDPYHWVTRNSCR